MQGQGLERFVGRVGVQMDGLPGENRQSTPCESTLRGKWHPFQICAEVSVARLWDATVLYSGGSKEPTGEDRKEPSMDRVDAYRQIVRTLIKGHVALPTGDAGDIETFTVFDPA